MLWVICVLLEIENEYGAQSKLQGAAGQNYVNWAAKMAVEMGTGVSWVMCKEDDAPDLVDGLRITYFWIKEQIEKEKAQVKSDAQWELLNRKAVAMIRKYIDKTLFEHVSTYSNVYELWTKLESMIQKKTPRNKANLVRQLVKLEYKDGHSMIEHLNNFKGLVNQLTKIEMKIDDELQALLLLSSLLESWDTLVVTLSNSAPEGKLTMDTVSDSPLGEEARRMERGESIHPEANVIENRGRNETRGCNKSRDLSFPNTIQHYGCNVIETRSRSKKVRVFPTLYNNLFWNLNFIFMMEKQLLTPTRVLYL
ncbi:Retrovirus-related Pol polyprotein from transposon TNT 1-94 [Glycine soja]|uniref:Retrovirus-related Pol polyprotein from transposon TNT 1-94 n=1 Tax=Glycine soja TaxID=3848 RepID=A0A445IZ99_GLYSO|nr:Retrovirus-related Pol polyprotein from transposon TNT 1-94 [Glycine soja]